MMELVYFSGPRCLRLQPIPIWNKAAGIHIVY